jgi:hypothetical protein
MVAASRRCALALKNSPPSFFYAAHLWLVTVVARTFQDEPAFDEIIHSSSIVGNGDHPRWLCAGARR